MFPAMDENGVTSVLRSYLRGRLARELLEDVAGFSVSSLVSSRFWRCFSDKSKFSEEHSPLASLRMHFFEGVDGPEAVCSGFVDRSLLTAAPALLVLTIGL